MEFGRLLQIVGDEPVFETGLLLAGEVNPDNVRRQLSRWTEAGRIDQLRRGVYTLAPPFQKVKPHPFLVANHLVPNSYVSLQSALAYHGLIPEVVHVTTSVTTGRPAQWQTRLGAWSFRHVKAEWFFGYRGEDLGEGQAAFVATPEKALLDLVYLQQGGDKAAFLESLRLQNLERLDLDELWHHAGRVESPKLHRAAAHIAELAHQEAQEYEVL